MAQHSAELMRCLRECDVMGAWRVWAHAAPGMPQPKTEAEAETILHHARSQMMALPFRARAYSHAWLIERGLPSGLPDYLRGKAERMYPRIVEGVGIAVKTQSEWMRPALEPMRRAMETAVLEAYADGRKDPDYVKARIQEARRREQKRLFGSTMLTGKQ